MKKRMVLAATATVAVGLGAGSASAADYLYWTSFGQNSSIARAQTSGSGLENAFITLPAQTVPLSIAVTGTKIAWMSGNTTPYSLNTAGLDGSGTASTSLSNSATPDQFAAQGSYVYYPVFQGKLGRVGLDFSGANSAFTAVMFPSQGSNVLKVTSDANYLYGVSPGNDQIARMTLAGVLDNETFITGLSGIVALAVTDKYIFWVTNQAIGRANIDGTDKQTTWVQTAGTNTSIAADASYVYWGHQQGQTRQIGRVKVDGTDKAENFISGLTGEPTGLAVTSGGGASPTPTPAPTPAPTPTPTPAATTLATPTVNTSAPGENAVVTVRTQLGAKGKYTFIFEKPSANEMSREQATSNRVAMQKGTRIGTRRLKKAYTAAVITTTADNAKVVTRALLRKAQAKKLNLRVVYAPTGTAQSESVIKIK